MTESDSTGSPDFEADPAPSEAGSPAPIPVDAPEPDAPASVGMAASPAPGMGTTAALGPKGKVRSPLGGWLLLFPTLGLYYLFWYHHINREMRDYDPNVQVSPGWAVVAQFVPIVNLVSIYNTGKRIAQVQATTGAAPEASGGLGVIGGIFLTLVLPYYNSQLNRAWTA